MITHIRVAVYAALLLVMGTLTVAAQDIALSSRDGKIELSGTLLGFDGEFYRVATEYGELTIDSSGVQCAGPGCPNLDNFVAELLLSGSATMGRGLMPALIDAFAARNGYRAVKDDEAENRFTYRLEDEKTGQTVARFLFSASNADEGFADLLADEADIVMSLREMRPQERLLAREAGLGDMKGSNRSRVLALDAVVPVVSVSNPIRSISPLMLAQVFSGQISNWKTFGGPDAPIDLHLPDDSSGLAQAIYDQVMHNDLAELAAAVEKDSLSIGITSYAEQQNTAILTLSGSCGFSLDVSRLSIKTEDYPLTAPMFLYFPARRLPQIAREFLSFTRSPNAQLVIRRAGFVDQTAEEIPVEEQGNRFANAITVAGPEISLDELQKMTATLTPMARLTTSFRFEAGSVRLDAQSRSNVQQLARALEIGQYDTRRLLFVGFSDGQS